ncbi:reprolysin-like metallopeptidase [Tautonia rosea]|uniref:reprolysin-like metallopeptidase n=1 Tax=Tautonia rosea TaxID=2728037 RepID=UPI0014758C1E|nr:zinc-dependent metalloprotease family protein [Tautonia rosea]
MTTQLAIFLAMLTLGQGGERSIVQPGGGAGGYWRSSDLSQTLKGLEVGSNRPQVPLPARRFLLDSDRLGAELAQAPMETAAKAQRPTDGQGPLPRSVIKLPMPDGSLMEFQVEESPVMSEGLQRKFPHLRTYRARSLDRPSYSARLDFNFKTGSFHAQILSPGDTITIDPTGRKSDAEELEYGSFSKRDVHARPRFDCEAVQFDEIAPEAGGEPAREGPDPGAKAAARSRLEDARRNDLAGRGARRTGMSLRVYRIAVICTGEYAQFHGGTLDSALEAIRGTVNRVNGIYERELAVKLELVDDQDELIFLDPETDSLDNNDADRLMGQSQFHIDSIIGNANYDIGHAFSTGAGGKALVGCVCRKFHKAKGVTGRSNPVGDAYDVDFVSHEIGHQFGANHTFNGIDELCTDDQRHADTAFEPGSGSTIMAYAGICGDDDLQSYSNDYFHSASLAEIDDYITTGPGQAAHIVQALDNTPPTVVLDSGFHIPHRTPFYLTAQGIDADGDSIVYCWEQRDLGEAAPATAPDMGEGPIFRSFAPSTDPWRLFPRLPDILANRSTMGEQFPSTTRTLTFRVTVRDDHNWGGATNGQDGLVHVHGDAGPFRVAYPNARLNLSGGTTVTWDVAGTDTGEIAVSRVNIWLSTDGGQSFDTALATDVPNDGSQLVTLPGIATSTARIMVEAVDNIFFDISDTDFSIVSSSGGLALVAPADEEDPAALIQDLSTTHLDRIITSNRGYALQVARAIASSRGLEVQEVENLTTTALELSEQADRENLLFIGDMLEASRIAERLGDREGTSASRPNAKSDQAVERSDFGSPRSASRASAAQVIAIALHREGQRSQERPETPTPGADEGDLTNPDAGRSEKTGATRGQSPSRPGRESTPEPGGATASSRPGEAAHRTPQPELSDYVPEPGADAGSVVAPGDTPLEEPAPTSRPIPFRSPTPELSDYVPQAGTVLSRPEETPTPAARRSAHRTPQPALNDYVPEPGTGAGRPTAGSESSRQGGGIGARPADEYRSPTPEPSDYTSPVGSAPTQSVQDSNRKEVRRSDSAGADQEATGSEPARSEAPDRSDDSPSEARPNPRTSPTPELGDYVPTPTNPARGPDDE